MAVNRENLIAACRAAHQASLDEGTYGRKGWFTGWDVKRLLSSPPPYLVPELDVLVDEGVLVRGTYEEAYAISTSANIYKVVGL